MSETQQLLSMEKLEAEMTPEPEPRILNPDPELIKENITSGATISE